LWLFSSCCSPPSPDMHTSIDMKAPTYFKCSSFNPHAISPKHTIARLSNPNSASINHLIHPPVTIALSLPPSSSVLRHHPHSQRSRPGRNLCVCDPNKRYGRPASSSPPSKAARHSHHSPPPPLESVRSRCWWARSCCSCCSSPRLLLPSTRSGMGNCCCCCCSCRYGEKGAVLVGVM